MQFWPSSSDDDGLATSFSFVKHCNRYLTCNRQKFLFSCFFEEKRMKASQQNQSDSGSKRPTTHTWPPTQPHEKEGWRHPHQNPHGVPTGRGRKNVLHCTPTWCSTATTTPPLHATAWPAVRCGLWPGQLSEELSALLGPFASHPTVQDIEVGHRFWLPLRPCPDVTRASCQLPIERHGTKGGHPR